MHKILSPSNTRWLSVKQCIDRVLEQYVPLKAYIRQTCFDDPSYTLQEMQNTMNNEFTVAYLEFLSYVLGILCDFNIMFQAEKPLLYRLKPEVKNMLKHICSNFMDVSYILNTDILMADHTNPRHFLPLNNIYLGVLASETFDNLQRNPEVDRKDLDFFLKSILNFYIELVNTIKSKFDFRGEIFEFLSILDPQVARKLEIKTLRNVLKRFPVLKNHVDAQALDNEWRKHSLMNHSAEGLDSSESADLYWSKVFALKTPTGSPIFKNLQVAINLLLVLPFSNASVERIFSTLKNCKNTHRNKLKTETLVNLIATKEGVKEQNGCVVFEPTKAMLKAQLWE